MPSDTPSTNTITDVSIDDVKFDSDPVITTSPSLSITNISTAGTTIITTTGSLMTKSDMIGEVDDDDEEMNGPNSSSLDTEGISIEVPQSRVGIVMDDEDENEQNAVVQGVLVRLFQISEIFLNRRYTSNPKQNSITKPNFSGCHPTRCR